MFCHDTDWLLEFGLPQLSRLAVVKQQIKRESDRDPYPCIDSVLPFPLHAVTPLGMMSNCQMNPMSFQ